MTPEQEARAEAERDPSPRYDDGRPKMHRHFAEIAVHLDEECNRPGTRRRVYVFDTKELEAHEAWITARVQEYVMDEDERLSRALDSLTNRAYTAEAEVKKLRAENEELRANLEACLRIEWAFKRAEPFNRADRAEAALADLRALCDEYRANCDPSTTQAQVAEIFRARLEAAVSRGRESTVEIGGQVMTQAQFDAARYPLLHPDPGPTLRGGPYPYDPTLAKEPNE